MLVSAIARGVAVALYFESGAGYSVEHIAAREKPAARGQRPSLLALQQPESGTIGGAHDRAVVPELRRSPATAASPRRKTEALVR
jgi:hypothetical protein